MGSGTMEVLLEGRYMRLLDESTLVDEVKKDINVRDVRMTRMSSWA